MKRDFTVIKHGFASISGTKGVQINTSIVKQLYRHHVAALEKLHRLNQLTAFESLSRYDLIRHVAAVLSKVSNWHNRS